MSVKIYHSSVYIIREREKLIKIDLKKPQGKKFLVKSNTMTRGMTSNKLTCFLGPYVQLKLTLLS